MIAEYVELDSKNADEVKATSEETSCADDATTGPNEKLGYPFVSRYIFLIDASSLV